MGLGGDRRAWVGSGGGGLALGFGLGLGLSMSLMRQPRATNCPGYARQPGRHMCLAPSCANLLRRSGGAPVILT